MLEWTRINRTVDTKTAAQPAPPRPMAPPPVPIPAANAVAGPSKPAPAPAPSAVPKASEDAPRPSIKLKIGGSAAAATPTPQPAEVTPKPKPAPKPKGRKPKAVAVDVPPEPMVDDGSFDLLEEVIAIEREKERENGVKKQVAPKVDRIEIPKPPPIVPGKRKKSQSVGLIDDEEILALASPSKKRSRSPGPAEKVVKEASPPKVTATINLKLRKPAEPSPAPPVVSTLPVVPLRQSSKGKEKEHAPSPVRAPSKAPKTTSTGQAAPINKTKCRDLLKNLLKLPEAQIFSRPVDPELDGCPTCAYINWVKLPNLKFLILPLTGTTRRSRTPWTLAR